MSMFQRGCVALLVLAASACTGSSSTPPATPSPTATTFALSGQITDNVAATGIAGATVSIADGSNAGKSTTTDVAGNYTLTGLTSSTFTLNVAANLYVTATKSTEPTPLTPDDWVRIVRNFAVRKGVGSRLQASPTTSQKLQTTPDPLMEDPER